MRKQTTRSSITWMLILAVFAAPIFLGSCSDDDDDNGGNGTSNNQNNNNNNNQNQQDGSFGAEFTGGIQQEFEGNAFYLDSNVFDKNTPYNPDEDGALTLRLATKESVKDSASVTAIILKNEDKSPVSKGIYEVKEPLYLENDVRTGASVIANTFKAESTLTATGDGSIEITSRNDGVVKGTFNDVKMTTVSFGQGGVDSVSVTLTGSFACEKADR